MKCHTESLMTYHYLKLEVTEFEMFKWDEL